MGRPKLYDQTLNFCLPEGQVSQLRQIACHLTMKLDEPVSMGDVVRTGVNMVLDMPQSELLKRIERPDQ